MFLTCNYTIAGIFDSIWHQSQIPCNLYYIIILCQNEPPKPVLQCALSMSVLWSSSLLQVISAAAALSWPCKIWPVNTMSSNGIPLRVFIVIPDCAVTKRTKAFRWDSPQSRLKRRRTRAHNNGLVARDPLHMSSSKATAVAISQILPLRSFRNPVINLLIPNQHFLEGCTTERVLCNWPSILSQL